MKKALSVSETRITLLGRSLSLLSSALLVKTAAKFRIGRVVGVTMFEKGEAVVRSNFISKAVFVTEVGPESGFKGGNVNNGVSVSTTPVSLRSLYAMYSAASGMGEVARSRIYDMPTG